jgi:hypothetical protein
METAMDEKTPDARPIAEEAVGEIRGTPSPEPAKDQVVARAYRGRCPATCDLGWTTGGHGGQDCRGGWREGRRCIR